MAAKDRKTARYARQLDVNVAGLEIVTTNVAAGGVQLCCPDMRYRGFQNSAKDGALAFTIRVPGSREWIGVEGRVRYADLCDDEVLIGFQFTEWSADGADRWLAYIETLADSKPLA